MFSIAFSRLFWWPVSVMIPDPAKPGAFEAHRFEAQFEAMSLDEGKAIDAERNALPENERDAHRFDYVVRKTRGWRDVTDAQGVDVPFTAQALDELMGFTWFRLAMAAAYGEAMSGQAARLGN